MRILPLIRVRVARAVLDALLGQIRPATTLHQLPQLRQPPAAAAHKAGPSAGAVYTRRCVWWAQCPGLGRYRRIVRTCTSLNFVALRYYASAGQQACQELTRDRTFAGPRVVEGQGASLEQSIARRRRSAADTQLQYLLVEAAALGPTVASR